MTEIIDNVERCLRSIILKMDLEIKLRCYGERVLVNTIGWALVTYIRSIIWLILACIQNVFSKLTMGLDKACISVLLNTIK